MVWLEGQGGPCRSGGSGGPKRPGGHRGHGGPGRPWRTRTTRRKRLSVSRVQQSAAVIEHGGSLQGGTRANANQELFPAM